MADIDDSQGGRGMEQLSDVERGLLPAAILGPMTRMGEKVAGIEGRFGAEIAALKDDTSQIRRTMHDIANAQQAAIGAERQCAIQLGIISEKLSAHSDQVTANVTTQKDSMIALGTRMTELGDKVENLTTAHNQIQGVWWTLLKIAAAVAAVGAILWPTAKHLSFVP